MKTEVRYRVHRIPPLVSTPSHNYPADIITQELINAHFNNILSSLLSSPKWPLLFRHYGKM